MNAAIKQLIDDANPVAAIFISGQKMEGKSSRSNNEYAFANLTFIIAGDAPEEENVDGEYWRKIRRTPVEAVEFECPHGIEFPAPGSMVQLTYGRGRNNKIVVTGWEPLKTTKARTPQKKD